MGRFRCRIWAGGLGLLVVVAACSSSVSGTAPSTKAPTAGLPPSATTTAGVAAPRPGGPLVDSDGEPLPPAPAYQTGELDPATAVALDRLTASLRPGIDLGAIGELGDSGDPRLGWVVADLLRFLPRGDVADASLAAFNRLTGTELINDPFEPAWGRVTDLLIAWDLPAPPGYVDYKRELFTLIEPGWDPFFDDPEAEIDWRLVSWGGVRIDDRPLGAPYPCVRGCIPSLDDPRVTDAAGGAWYPDEAVVFAVSINGESRAYPKNIMEVHEMVNDTVGGRRIGLPYCTLCGSPQAYLTDSVPAGVEVPVLRTSGLLSRSNKVMYDLVSKSVFDTFTGRAVAGPLREAGVTLEQVSVIATTWGEWKAVHPDTTIVAEDGGVGRTYPADPLGGRDDNGPIFPVGDVDPRLAVQELVIGVVTNDGVALAFPAQRARAALAEGQTIEVAGVSLTADAGGIRAFTDDGAELAAHQAFWFAWSQFHPDTLLWEG